MLFILLEKKQSVFEISQFSIELANQRGEVVLSLGF